MKSSPENAINRRALLEGLAFLGPSILAVTSSLAKILGNVSKAAMNSIAEEGDELPKTYPFTNEQHNLYGANFRNVGVRHRGFDNEPYKQLFSKLIAEADIVLLEIGSAADKGISDPFFYDLEEVAKTAGKEVVYVDDRSPLAETLIKIGAVASTTVAGLQSLIDATTITDQTTATRRSFLRALGVAGLGGMYMSGNFGPLHDNISTDYSYSVDGRTINMLSKAIKIAKTNPGKRILLLSGDGHAKAMEEYLTPEGVEIFERKKAIYDATYNSALGLK